MTFLPHFFSHDPLGLCSHIILGFLSASQGVSCFPGESGASGRERGPVTPVGRTLYEVSVVLRFSACVCVALKGYKAQLIRYDVIAGSKIARWLFSAGEIFGNWEMLMDVSTENCSYSWLHLLYENGKTKLSLLWTCHKGGLEIYQLCY